VQMDAEFEKEQIGTLIVWVGPPGGGLGGGWSIREVQPNFCTCLPSKFFIPSCFNGEIFE